MVAPGVQRLTLYIGNAAVVENKRNIRAFRNQIGRNGELARENTDVEREAVFAKAGDVLDEHFSLADFVRARVKNSPDSFHFEVRGKRFDVRFESVAFRPARCNDARDTS